MDHTRTLSEIEKEILITLTDGKSYWTKCYQLMRIVEKERLYLEADYRSFTAWLKAFQYKAGVNISILWQQKKAGSYYESYKSKADKEGVKVPDIDHVRIAPTNLVYIEKISESHPWLEDQLMKKAIGGNVTRRELKNTWECIKTERIAKGELKARETRHDKDKISVTIEEKLSATKAMLCVQSDHSWLPVNKTAKSVAKYDAIASFEIEHEGKICMYDILVAETLTAGENDIIIHGLILLKEDNVIDKNNLNEYRKFVDYLWVMVPDQYGKTETIPEDLGIISINSNITKKQIDVIQRAKKMTGGLKGKVINNLLMRYLKNANH